MTFFFDNISYEKNIISPNILFPKITDHQKDILQEKYLD